MVCPMVLVLEAEVEEAEEQGVQEGQILALPLAVELQDMEEADLEELQDMEEEEQEAWELQAETAAPTLLQQQEQHYFWGLVQEQDMQEQELVRREGFLPQALLAQEE